MGSHKIFLNKRIEKGMYLVSHLERPRGEGTKAEGPVGTLV